MKIRVDDPALLPDLVADLSRCVDTVVTQIASNELEVSLLGSRCNAADVAELAARLRAWGQGAEIAELRLVVDSRER